MNESQRITCRSRRENGNCLLAEEKEQLRRDFEQLKTDHCALLERNIEANGECLRLEAEAAAMREALETIRRTPIQYPQLSGISPWITAQRALAVTSAGADLLARHAAEVAVYRDALDEIRELAVAEYRITEAEEEINSLADQALNDHRITGGSK